MIEIILTAAYGILGLFHVYIFLFQRTVRKIRMFGFGSELRGVENFLYPQGYIAMHYITYLRFVPLVWLAIINWKLALVSFGVISLLKVVLPSNDYGTIQIIKKKFEDDALKNTPTEIEAQLYDLVLQAEAETLK
jgi:hypothetical protein